MKKFVIALAVVLIGSWTQTVLSVDIQKFIDTSHKDLVDAIQKAKDVQKVLNDLEEQAELLAGYENVTKSKEDLVNDVLSKTDEKGQTSMIHFLRAVVIDKKIDDHQLINDMQQKHMTGSVNLQDNNVLNLPAGTYDYQDIIIKLDERVQQAEAAAEAVDNLGAALNSIKVA